MNCMIENQRYLGSVQKDEWSKEGITRVAFIILAIATISLIYKKPEMEIITQKTTIRISMCILHNLKQIFSFLFSCTWPLSLLQHWHLTKESPSQKPFPRIAAQEHKKSPNEKLVPQSFWHRYQLQPVIQIPKQIRGDGSKETNSGQKSKTEWFILADVGGG